MKIKWTISGTHGEGWKATAENEYVRVEAEADNLFSAMEKAEEELVKKTEEILRRVEDIN